MPVNDDRPGAALHLPRGRAYICCNLIQPRFDLLMLRFLRLTAVLCLAILAANTANAQDRRPPATAAEMRLSYAPIVKRVAPAVVTISNELGQPRYPTTARTMKARRMKPNVVTPGDLSLRAEEIRPRVKMTKQFVSSVQGNCEMIAGETPKDLADRLVARLRAERILS